MRFRRIGSIHVREYHLRVGKLDVFPGLTGLREIRVF
jgi:hypothetical protein